MIRVHVAHAHEMVRDALEVVLRQEPSLEVVGRERPAEAEAVAGDCDVILLAVPLHESVAQYVTSCRTAAPHARIIGICFGDEQRPEFEAAGAHHVTDPSNDYLSLISAIRRGRLAESERTAPPAPVNGSPA